MEEEEYQEEAVEFNMEDFDDAPVDEAEPECPVDSSSLESSSSEDSDAEDVVSDEEWTSTDTRKSFSFTDSPSMNVGTANSPLDYLKLLFNATFMNLLVATINLHAIQMQAECASTSSEPFIPTDVNEVYTLLAVYFFMGYIKINQFSYYWRVDYLYNLGFERHMSKDRFVILLRALAYKSKVNIHDNGDSRRSCYYAAKPIVDLFNKTMKSLVIPSKELNIDKSTAHWFNKLNFVKRKQERIRMHFLSDVRGIFLRVYLCHPDGDNKADEIVKFLMQDFLDSGRSLYACPFYTSITLAEDLLDKKTYLTGFLKRNKHRNPSFVRNNLKIGSIKSLYNSKGVCVCNLRKTNRTICLLSGEHSAKMITIRKTVETEMLAFFRQCTKGMFHRNQILTDNAPYDSTNKYNKFALYLLQVMFMNAFILHNANAGHSMSFSDFRMAILRDLLPMHKRHQDTNESDGDTDESIESMDQSVRFGEVIHLPVELSNHKRGRRNCRHCFLERGIKKRTQIYCPQCPKKWGLCLECFRAFHNY